MSLRTATCILAVLALPCYASGATELLRNGGFETLDAWEKCWGFRCDLIAADQSRFGAHSLRTYGRTQWYQGPIQPIQTVPGRSYRAHSWVKLMNDKPGKLFQNVQLEVSFAFPDGTHHYINVGYWPLLSTSDGWVFVEGDVQTPDRAYNVSKFYYQGPDPGVDFAVDLASVTEVTIDHDWRRKTNAVIDQVRKSDVHFRVTTAHGIDASKVQIQVLQKRKSFPFGTSLNSRTYVQQTAPVQKYRDFIHTHFNWAVPGLLLKWRQMERTEGHVETADAMATYHGLINHGLKLRGHNMVWSVEQFIPDWVKTKSGDELRNTVRRHMQQLCNLTNGLAQHWDVNNEELHGQWFQERLQDPDYDLELFRMAHQYCPDVKLFLNDYDVVSQGSTTGAYVAQTQRYKAANVGLYGIGAQMHFHTDQMPEPTLIKEHIDHLAQSNVPIWVTELTCDFADEHRRADCYETALRATYGHPKIEGIIMWGVWDQDHYLGESGSLVVGNDLKLTEAGRRVLDLYENQWMTDETHVLSQAGNQFTVRSFHGDYEVHVRYNGHELSNLKQTFTLGKADKTIHLNVHT